MVVGAGHGTLVDTDGCFAREEGLDDGGLEELGCVGWGDQRSGRHREVGSVEVDVKGVDEIAVEVGDGAGGEQDGVAEAGRAGGPEELGDEGPGGRVSPDEGSVGNA